MQKRYWLYFFLLNTLLFLLVSCASTSTKPTSAEDPYENFNRRIYLFNEIIDKNIVRPVAVVYDKIVPWPVTKGVTNFFANLNEIPTAINDLLQANYYQTTSDVWRFGINSTIGLLGLIDVASDMGLPKNDQDFGLTLAKWGYTSSTYVVLPLLGPSTIRDTLSIPVNYVTNVYTYLDMTTSLSLLGVRGINSRANLLNYDKLLNQAFDPYVFMRNAYLQKRDNQIGDNRVGRPHQDDSDNKKVE